MSRPTDYTSFRRFLRASHKSTRTVETYGEPVDQLGQSPDNVDGVPDVTGKLTRSHVEGFLVHLADQGRTAATLNNRYRSLHRFLRSWSTRAKRMTIRWSG